MDSTKRAKSPADSVADLLPVVRAAQQLGISICSRTAIRWCLHGIGGRRLPSVKVAGRRLTTVDALKEWIAATQDAAAPAADLLDPVDANAVLTSYSLGRAQESES